MTADFKNSPRHRADRLEWEQIASAKLGPCRCCGQWGSSFHHLVPRSLGGDDVADNIVPLCGDGVRGCHGDVEARVPTALNALRQSLRPEELRYILRTKGGGFLDRYLPTAEAGSDPAPEHEQPTSPSKEMAQSVQGEHTRPRSSQPSSQSSVSPPSQAPGRPVEPTSTPDAGTSCT